MSVRGHRTGDGFRAAVADHLRQQAQIGRAVTTYSGPSPAKQTNVSALEALAKFVAGLDLADPRLVALWHIHSVHGGGRLDFRPGRQQAELIAHLGLHDAPPSLSDCLNELVEAAVEDLISARNEELRIAAQDVSRADEKLRKVKTVEERAEKAEEALAVEQRTTVQLGAEIERLRKERDYLKRALAGGEGQRTTKPKAKSRKPEARELSEA
jgi:hypothetical protein